MSTMILPRRLPPYERCPWPEPHAAMLLAKPSSLFVMHHSGVIPEVWSATVPDPKVQTRKSSWSGTSVAPLVLLSSNRGAR